MKQFIRDNLLLSSGRIKHDRSIPQAEEKLSPTTERLIVLRWLEILHPQLPNHVATVFAHELQGFSLKDLQPRIANQIDDLLSQLESKSNEIGAQFSRLSTRKTLIIAVENMVTVIIHRREDILLRNLMGDCSKNAKRVKRLESHL